jgi:hypothetical protein
VVLVQPTAQPYGSPESVDHDVYPGALVGEPADEEGQVLPRSVAERRRAEAVKSLEKKRGWQAGMVAYVVVNAFLVGIWAMTGRGYFWPAWPIGGWGLGMALSFWDVFVRRPITEEDIEAELRRR